MMAEYVIHTGKRFKIFSEDIESTYICVEVLRKLPPEVAVKSWASINKMPMHKATFRKNFPKPCVVTCE